MTYNRIILLVILLISSISAYQLMGSYNQVQITFKETKQKIKQQQLKRESLMNMYNAARERSLILLRMTGVDDLFELDDLNTEFGVQARNFIKARTRFISLPMTDKERAILALQNQATIRVSPIQNRLAEMMISGNKEDAKKLLFEQALPGQNEVLSHINKIMQVDTQNMQTSVEGLTAGAEAVHQNFLLLGLSSAGMSLLIVFVIINRASRKEHAQLRETLLERENHIHESEIAKKELEDLEERWKFALEGSGDGVWDWDVATNKTFYSKQWKAMLGFEDDDIGDSPDEKINRIHPEDIEQSELSLKAHIEGETSVYQDEHRVKCKDGSYKWVHDQGMVVSWVTEGQPARIIGTYSDITKHKEAAKKLTHQASHDALTGLINRRAFEQRLSNLLEEMEEDERHAVLYLDLDQFKVVNDTCGHHAGDELLRQITKLIQEKSRRSDLVARLGGDEFGIILTSCNLEQAIKVASSVLNDISNYQFYWENQSFKVGVSIGVVEISDLDLSVHDVMKHADSACYVAKDNGRNQVHVYKESSETLRERAEQMDWVSQINESINNNNFIIYAQPIVPTQKNSDVKVSYELLVRMTDNEKIIPPNAFLPAAERYNLIKDIDWWVVTHALRMLEKSPAFVDAIDHCSINISAQSLVSEEFMQFLTAELKRSGLSKKICLEITETAAISNLVQATRYISSLHEIGVRFSLDDFGSGLSSFGYLKTLEIDYLKIDGLFVKDIVDDPIDRAMVKSIHEIGSVMGKKTIAEYVENEDILNVLRKIGVDFAQGYGISKPVPLDQVLAEFN